jgi:hypothetical protein
MAAKANKAKKKKAIADVAHPGTTAPSDTSKSIITHRPMIKDPMVVAGAEPAEADAETEPSSRRVLIKTSELKIEPPKTEPATETEETKQEEPATEPEKTEPEEQAPEVPREEKSEASAPEKPAEPAEADKSDSADDKPDDADKMLDTKKPKAPDLEAESAEQAAAAAKLEQLIDSKKYFLPINTVEHRRSRRFIMLGVVVALLLALAWVDIALDAGIIHLDGVKPLTHFFSG